jgi:hypothetical protein
LKLLLANYWLLVARNWLRFLGGLRLLFSRLLGDRVNYTLEYLKKKHKRVTTETMMDASGVPREDWEAEMISELPRQMKRHAEKLAEEARQERD